MSPPLLDVYFNFLIKLNSYKEHFHSTSIVGSIHKPYSPIILLGYLFPGFDENQKQIYFSLLNNHFKSNSDLGKIHSAFSLSCSKAPFNELVQEFIEILFHDFEQEDISHESYFYLFFV
jgi:hypothetical protein